MNIAKQRFCFWVAVVMAIASFASMPGGAANDSIFARHAADLPSVTLPAFAAADARLLRNDPNGIAAELQLPPNWRSAYPAIRHHSIELLVLEGSLRWGHGVKSDTLEQYGYLQIPAEASWPRLESESGARVLVFMDPPQPGDGKLVRAVTTNAADWQPGMVAQRDTGIALKLEVRDLHFVAETGRRTWLLRAGADLKLPWERHRTIEEGYLVAGDYRLVECIDGHERPYDYQRGGYFFRAPGIIHGGPATGSKSDIVMLLRTPEKLTVEFLPGCSATPEPQHQ